MQARAATGWRATRAGSILSTMTQPDSRVRMAEAASGARTYLVDLPPEALPPVRARDLHAAWDSARGAALSQQWGRPLMLRFRRPGAAADETATELALADADACCWAAAVDGTVGLDSAYGLSLCLRLLALVEVLPRAPWALPLVAINRDGAALHPALLRAAAQTPLAPDASFDPACLRAALRQDAPLAAPEAIPALAAPTRSGARA
jgi:hypothetical protein